MHKKCIAAAQIYPDTKPVHYPLASPFDYRRCEKNSLLCDCGTCLIVHKNKLSTQGLYWVGGVIQQLFTMFAWADVILSYFSVNSILEKDVPTSHKSAENLTAIDFLNTRSFFNPKREKTFRF